MGKLKSSCCRNMGRKLACLNSSRNQIQTPTASPAARLFVRENWYKRSISAKENTMFTFSHTDISQSIFQWAKFYCFDSENIFLWWLRRRFQFPNVTAKWVTVLLCFRGKYLFPSEDILCSCFVYQKQVSCKLKVNFDSDFSSQYTETIRC